MIHKYSVFLTIFLMTMSSCGSDTATNNGAGDPSSDGSGGGYRTHHGQDVDGSRNFAELMNSYSQGRIDHAPWGNTFWPYKTSFSSNGIASTKFGNDRKFSPAGRYDAAHGCITKAQDWEIAHHGTKDPHAQGWWGHCNGWSAAASFFPEPPELMKVNGIEFSRSDIKALLTEAGMVTNADYFGEKVDPAKWVDYNSPEYNDIVPDQYFLVLTNYMGKQSMPIVVDEFTGAEIWNQPIAGYRFEKPKPSDVLPVDPAHPNISRVLFTSTLWWGSDGVDPNSKTPDFNFQDDGTYFISRTLKGEIWLDAPPVFDAQGNLVSSGDVVVSRSGIFFVGGAWHNPNLDRDHAHPDFMWLPLNFLDAGDPQDNPPENFDANPYIDYKWLIKHFINQEGDDPDVHPCPIPPAAPSPSPVPSPSTSPGPSASPSPNHSGIR